MSELHEVFKNPFGNGAALAQQVQIVLEETLHRANFGFMHVQGPNGDIWALTFDVQLGPGTARRVTVPFDGLAIDKFESQLRAWRAGIEIP